MKTVIEMAREAGAIPIHKKPKDVALVGIDAIERFAQLVAKKAVEAEREACARVCCDMQRGWASDDHLACAAAIRARR
jgi:hypothetical protein